MLGDEATIAENRIRSGSTIHVFKKTVEEPEPAQPEIKDAEIDVAVYAYRKIFLQPVHGSFSVK